MCLHEVLDIGLGHRVLDHAGLGHWKQTCQSLGWGGSLGRGSPRAIRYDMAYVMYVCIMNVI